MLGEVTICTPTGVAREKSHLRNGVHERKMVPGNQNDSLCKKNNFDGFVSKYCSKPFEVYWLYFINNNNCISQGAKNLIHSLTADIAFVIFIMQ